MVLYSYDLYLYRVIQGKCVWSARLSDLLDRAADLHGVQVRIHASDPGLHSDAQLFTLDGARALKLQHVTGSLETGKSADLIVLEDNLFEIPASRIGDTRVVLTLFEGRQVFTDPPSTDRQAAAPRLPASASAGE